MAGGTLSLLVVCTGNTCRSVMSALMLEHLGAERGLALSVASAGTHALEGVPVGARTLAAMRTVPELVPLLGAPPSGGFAGSHRSRQLVADDLSGADLVVAMEAAHVRFVRRRHRDAASRTGMLRSLVRALAPGPPPLAARVAALRLEHAVPDDADDVADPAGRADAGATAAADAAAYAACAAELWSLCGALVDRL